MKGRLEATLKQEISRLKGKEGITGIGLVGSLRGDLLWEGSDIDIVIVRDQWTETTPAYDCRLRRGTIIHTTILTREDLALRREEARTWITDCKILWDPNGEITRAKNAYSKNQQEQGRSPSPEEVYEAEIGKSARSMEQGDVPSCLILTRRAALKTSSNWLRRKGVITRAGGRRGMDNVLSGLRGLGEAEMEKCLLDLFQADVNSDHGEKLLERMKALSLTTYDYLNERMLVRYLEPSELGLLHHASTGNELLDFLEALYRPLALHYPRSMTACCQSGSVSLAEGILKAQARRTTDGKQYHEETLVQSLQQADLPQGFLDDFIPLQRFHTTHAAQRQAIRQAKRELRHLITR